MPRSFDPGGHKNTEKSNCPASVHIEERSSKLLANSRITCH